MMQRVVTMCLGLLLLTWQGVSASDLTLYGVVITNTIPSPEDGSNGDILGQPEKIRVLNLGKVVNHSGLDYAPSVSADGKTLYFVSNRKGSRITRDGDFSHDFWQARKENNLDTIFFVPTNIDTVDAGVNTPTNEGAVSIAADRQSIYFTGCNRTDGLGDCDLYVSEIDGDRWAQPQNMGRAINTEWWDSQPSISPDKSRIYFSSNRPSETNPDGGGEDDTDLWYSDFDSDLKEWQPAKNLGPDVNTSGREEAPFIASDGHTLFFSSDGHKPNMGGLDFYVAKRTGENDRAGRYRWDKPRQLPVPINTPEDDQFITLPASGDVLYFSSRRTDLPGSQGDLDIFMAYIPIFFKSVNVIVNVIDECTQQSIPATLTFKNIKTGRDINAQVTTSDTSTNFIVTKDDYGTIDNKSNTIQWTATATSPVYGTKSITIDVVDPGTSDNPTMEPPTEIRKTIVLGKRPTLTWDAEFPDAVKNGKVPSWKGLMIEERASVTIYPQLPYVFFDLKSGEIPERYVQFTSASQTANFSDETLPPATLDKYYQMLNVFGYRLKKHPTVKVKLVGCVDEKNESKDKPLSAKRAQVVFDYLKNIWGIEESRMTIEPRGAYPLTKSNPNDSLGVVENRRCEMLFDGDPEEVWLVARPILDKDPTPFPTPGKLTYSMSNGIDNEIVASRRIEILRGGTKWNTLTQVGMAEPTADWDFKNENNDKIPGKADRLKRDEKDRTFEPMKAQLVVVSKNGSECRSDVVTIPVRGIASSKMKIDEGTDSTLERYNLILFPFDRFDAGPMNERILNEYVYGRVKPTSAVAVEGHTDVVGEYNHNKTLSEKRARTVRELIQDKTKGKVGALASVGTGEDTPLYRNELPEERFFNRTVQVIVRTPLKDAELE